MKVTKFQYYNRFKTILAHNQHILLVKDSINEQVGPLDNIYITSFRQICVQSAISNSICFFQCPNLSNNIIPVCMNNDQSNQIGMRNLNNGQVKQSIKTQYNQFIIVHLENKPIDLAIVIIGRQKNFLYRKLKLIRIIQYELDKWFTIFDVKLNLDSVFMTIVKETRQQNKLVFIVEVNIDGCNSLGNGQRSMKNQNSKRQHQRSRKFAQGQMVNFIFLRTLCIGQITYSRLKSKNMIILILQMIQNIQFILSALYYQCKYQKNWRIRGKKKQRQTLQIIYRYNHLLDYN